MSKKHVPGYVRHKARNLGKVRLAGWDYYLPGEYNSEESLSAYHRAVAEWLQSGATPKARPHGGDPLTINELLVAFFRRQVQNRYVKNGMPTSEQQSFATALGPLKRLYGYTPADEFTPAALVVCRRQLIDAGYTRKRINQHVGRIRRAFKWGVQNGLVDAGVWHALGAIEALRFGEAQAEAQKVPPAPEAAVAAIKAHVTPPVWAMIQTQLWTGARPGEVCTMRTCDIQTEMPVGLEHIDPGNCLIYVPESHKTEHHDKRKIVFIGPKARAIIEPWLRPDEPEAYLFSPREARRWYNAKIRAAAKTPRKTTKGLRTGGRRQPRSHYDTATYGRAIRRACEQAEVEHWHPHQLRHNAASRLRAEYGVEVAQIILGHASVTTTEGYAEPDWAAAADAIGKSG